MTAMEKNMSDVDGSNPNFAMLAVEAVTEAVEECVEAFSYITSTRPDFEEATIYLGRAKERLQLAIERLELVCQ